MRIGLVGLFVLVMVGCDTTPVEICGNGIDDDLDGLTDCEEALCRCSDVEICTGGLDEDADGLIDCRDDDCDGEAVCIEAVCDDALDNDGDGAVDCLDSDCDGGCPEVCDDGRDNDGDGLIDCEDAECVDEEVCGELLCDDGIDDDDDGLIDCADDDCWGLNCHPDGIATQITDGELRIANVSHVTTTRTTGYYTSYVSGTTVDIDCPNEGPTVLRVNETIATLNNIRGVARVTVGGVAQTCDFSFSELVASGDTVLTPGTRVGFTVQDASRCQLDGTSWLPRTLTPNGSRLDAGVIRRYGIAAPQTHTETASAVNITSFHDGSCSRIMSTVTSSEAVYGVNVTGDEVTVLP